MDLKSPAAAKRCCWPLHAARTSSTGWCHGATARGRLAAPCRRVPTVERRSRRICTAHRGHFIFIAQADSTWPIETCCTTSSICSFFTLFAHVGGGTRRQVVYTT